MEYGTGAIMAVPSHDQFESSQSKVNRQQKSEDRRQ